MVSNLSIVFIIVALIAGFLLPIGACIFIKKKFGCSIRPFFMGCLIFFTFVVVLESFVHSLILNNSIGQGIRDNTFLFALYGGLMAGIFEETGRLFAYKYLFRKNYRNDYDSLMYGAGHGGFEAFYILVPGMISNLVLAFMINSGKSDLLFVGQPEEAIATIESTIDSIISINSPVFLVSIVERISAMGIHLAMSVIVWFAVKNIKYGYYVLAILIHALIDAFTVILNNYTNVAVVEIVVCIMAAGSLYLAYRTYKNEHVEPEEQPSLVPTPIPGRDLGDK